jgi:hypothetical protein
MRPPLLALTSLALATAFVLRLDGVPAFAQTDDELAGARKLFAEAVTDEDATRYDTALEKFRRVEAVKDTANVRYRIATCLEALGRRAEALSNYQTAIHLAEGDRTATDAARESTARAAQLDRVVPHLTIVVPANAPPATAVRVDDQPVDANTLRTPLLLDPGHHTIAADAPGMAPYRTGVTLPEGGAVTITIALEPPPAASATTSTAPVVDAGLPPPVTSPAAGSSGASPLAIGLLGLGGALAVGSVVSFVLRGSNLDTLNKDCANPPAAPQPGSLSCPLSRTSEVNNAHNAAQIEGPLGWGLAGGAVASIGAGVWLLVRPRPAAAQGGSGVGVTPIVSQNGGMLVISGPLPR